MNLRNQLFIPAVLSACCVLSAADKLPETPVVKAWKKSNTGKAAEKFAPVIGDNSITFGNKTLRMGSDGKLSCVASDGTVLFNGGHYFWVIDKGTPVWDWAGRNFDRKKSGLRREGSKFIYEFWYKLREQPSACLWSRTIEVMPDGTLGFTVKFNFPAKTDTFEFRSLSASFLLPSVRWKGTFADLGKKQVVLDEKVNVWERNQRTWIFGKDMPEQQFSVTIPTGKNSTIWLKYEKNSKEYSIHFARPSYPGEEVKFTLDLRQGIAAAAGNLRGGVDFKQLENLELPDFSRKNKLENSSFERGLEGWHWPSAIMYCNQDRQWDWEPFSIDPTESYDGKNSLKFTARNVYSFTSGYPHIGPTQVIAEPGTYTLSFYAKRSAKKKSELTVWIPGFHNGTGPIDNGKAHWKFNITEQWKRYSVSFRVKQGEPLLYIAFVRTDGERDGFVWLDAVQLEKGGKATAFQVPPAEGELITSQPDNFISSKDRIDGKLRITTARPGASGKVLVTVKNFFGEVLLNKTYTFRTGKDRKTQIALPLDELPGLGVFVVRTEYKLDNGETCYDMRRYAQIEFQTRDRLNRKMFSLDYSHPAMRFDFLKMLDRWRKLGVGSKHHILSRNAGDWAMYKKYGVEPFNCGMLSYTRGFTNFFIQGKDYPGWIYDINDKNNDLLLRDFKLDGNGTITPEYLAKVKQACKTVAQRYPHVKCWYFGGEISCKLPNDWWKRGATHREVIRMVVQLLKACAEGTREGNPDAKIVQDCPANMAPWGGIAETDLLLEESNKAGVKFDMIAIHPYRYSPENPDLDRDTVEFFKMLEKHGYGKTKIQWSEGMHWGPFEIPQWGTKCSSWVEYPTGWRGMISYDMGWTEKKAASWYARAWLVSLKYADRIVGFTAGMTKNNCYMDTRLTPYAAQLMANTLCCILGDAVFKKDVRFAPEMRTYIFEDEKKRPVAAVWCHQEKVDTGEVEAPMVSADFGGALEGVFDLMNSPRAFKKGKMTFQVSGFPLFFRGKPGTLNEMIRAFESAQIVSDGAVLPLAISLNPVDTLNAKVQIRNFISRDFTGSFNGRTLTIPASGENSFTVKLNTPLRSDRITRLDIPLSVRNSAGKKLDRNFKLDAFSVKKVADDATIDTVDWNHLAQVKIPRRIGKTGNSGTFRMGWNNAGIFIETVVKDDKFLHIEYPQPSERWKNDCLQIYFDTLANARARNFKGYDEDDYDYAVFPAADGKSAQVYRFRTVESQLGLATQAPPDRTFAPDIPCRFKAENGKLIYRVFFPARYLLPIRLQKNFVFGFGLFAADSDAPQKVNGCLTVDYDAKGCFNRPHTWPAAVLTE